MFSRISSLVALALIAPFAGATPASLSIPIPSVSTIPTVSGILSSATSGLLSSASGILSSVTGIPSSASGILSSAASGLPSSVSGVLSSATDVSSSLSGGSTTASTQTGSSSLTSIPSLPTSSFSTPTFSSSFEPLPTGIPVDMCDMAKRQCCAAARPENDPQLATILDAFDIDTPGDPNALVGVLCTNMTAVVRKRDSTLCSGDTQVPLCCSDNTHDGVVALDCLPVN